MDLNDLTPAGASLNGHGPAPLRQTTAAFVHTPGQVVHPDGTVADYSAPVSGSPSRRDRGHGPRGPAPGYLNEPLRGSPGYSGSSKPGTNDGSSSRGGGRISDSASSTLISYWSAISAT